MTDFGIVRFSRRVYAEEVTPRGGKRPGAGRKPGPASKRRSRGVLMKLTPAEYQRLARAALREGLPVATFARRLVFKGLR